MKINPRLILALIAASSLSAAPLTKPTAVHAQPDAASPAIALLAAGTDPITAATPAPAGWTAIELPGPHEVYVQNKDIMKSLDVRPGASFYVTPKTDAAVLTTMVRGDSAEISGLHGRWTQIRLQKKVVGYVGDGGSPSPVAAASPVASAAGSPVASASQPASAPVAVDPAASAYSGAGRSASTTAAPAASSGAPALPRLFEGTFSPAKRFLAYKPYEYQLNDRAGQRYAFLDVSRLMKSEQFARYLDRTVTVYGTAKPIPNTKDIVIEVESLQLR